MIKTRCFYHRVLGNHPDCDIGPALYDLCVRDTKNWEKESDVSIIRSCDGCEHYIERDEAKRIIDEYLENLSRNEGSN